jgi:hypothetical protein
MQDRLSADVLDPDRAMRDDMGLDDLLTIDFPGLRIPFQSTSNFLLE